MWVWVKKLTTSLDGKLCCDGEGGGGGGSKRPPNSILEFKYGPLSSFSSSFLRILGAKCVLDGAIYLVEAQFQERNQES